MQEKLPLNDENKETTLQIKMRRIRESKNMITRVDKLAKEITFEDKKLRVKKERLNELLAQLNVSLKSKGGKEL